MSTNALQACLDILTTPTETFALIKEKKHWSWAPFGLLIGTTTTLFLYYFSVVDFDWMVNKMLEKIAIENNMSQQELEITAEYMTKNSMLLSTLIGGVIGIFSVNAITALFYYLVSKAYSTTVMTYRMWLGFSWWTSMPGVVSVLLSMLVIMFSMEGLVTFEDLSPTSFGFLSNSSSPWFNLMNSLDLFSLWSIGLAALGLSNWLNLTFKQSSLIALTPTFIVYLIWALYVSFSG
ncbi:MAG TPA: hypothetical protein DCX08_03690 [Porticoccaceae bacterium]|jgi:hypothetical protein|nr:hypothetical protein [Porticoccaceae bacterium]